jgi:hypothetical protein
VVVATAVRVPVAILVTGGKDFTWKERAFIGLSWIPKATVQAALGSAPLDLIREKMDSTDPEFEEWEMWGKEILVTAVISILITAPIGLICINTLGPRWLSQKIQDDDSVTDDLLTNLNEAWAINERNRRQDDNVVALRKGTQVERFFTTLRDHLYKVKVKMSGSEEKQKRLGEFDDNVMLLSEIEVKTSNNAVNQTEDASGLSAVRLQDVMTELDIVKEGIELLYTIMIRNADVLPTAELFSDENGHFYDVPTQEEMMARLHEILKTSDMGETAESTDRRGSFNVIPSRLTNISLPQPSRIVSRSFSGYKPSNTDIEMFKAAHHI